MTDREQVELIVSNQEHVNYWAVKNKIPIEKAMDVVVEVIHGRYFCNERGETIVIGFSKKVEEILGLPLNVFEKMHNHLNILQEQNKDQKEKLLKYKSMTFWARLKFLFNKYEH